MKDRIIDGLTEEHIKGAVFQFEFLGHLVSMSQVFSPASIAIFKGSFEKHGFSSVQAALNFILQAENKPQTKQRD